MIGIAVHVGSDCSDPPTFANAIAVARKLFEVGQKVGYDFTLLDIGGGFPGGKTTNIAEVFVQNTKMNVERSFEILGNIVDCVGHQRRIRFALSVAEHKSDIRTRSIFRRICLHIGDSCTLQTERLQKWQSG